MAPLARGAALVTGGNRGLGLELCRKLVAKGTPVIIASRDLAAGRAACEQLGKAGGAAAAGLCSAVQFDATRPGSVGQLVEAVKAQHDQQISSLVNNAAVYLDEWSPSAFASSVETNFTAPIALARGLLPHLKPGATVVMVVSGYAKLQYIVDPRYREAVQGAASLDDLGRITYDPASPQGRDYVGVYKLTKAMLVRAAQLLSKDPAFVQRDVSVVAIDPGWCRTRMGGDAAPRSPEQGAESLLFGVQADRSCSGGIYLDGVPVQWPGQQQP